MAHNFSSFSALPKERYQGQWVVMVDGTVVASGSAGDMQRVMSRVRKQYPGKTPFLAKVPKKMMQIV